MCCGLGQGREGREGGEERGGEGGEGGGENQVYNDVLTSDDLSVGLTVHYCNSQVEGRVGARLLDGLPYLAL